MLILLVFGNQKPMMQYSYSTACHRTYSRSTTISLCGLKDLDRTCSMLSCLLSIYTSFRILWPIIFTYFDTKWKYLLFEALHIGAKCPFIFRWGFGKPLLRIQGFTENKKCSPEKISIIKYLQIDTLHTQKLEFFCLELACPRLGQQKWFFGEC